MYIEDALLFLYLHPRHSPHQSPHPWCAAAVLHHLPGGGYDGTLCQSTVQMEECVCGYVEQYAYTYVLMLHSAKCEVQRN